ncbi:ENTH-domain-containing protein [Leucogyrophana mollusca]|uniref:ENTH-domain-containing protein n=1 Tax=Leucogyrophana mollusca TaxID=85980 RepID=A0ACB8AXE2_9AGAM|nr:ENTH-domain-containing protein [Leucogyrophana mollusca]
MSLQHFGKGALRVAKNYTKGYSDTQAKVRDATSNDPWGPSGTQMNEIAQLTYNQNDFVEIMEMLDKRLNDKGKNWRHVFKSLTVLDYCLHAGSENVVIYFRDNVYIIKTLKEFQYLDEDGKDQGANVRQKAKDITNLLHDESRLREERRSRASMRDRMIRGHAPGEGDVDDDPRYAPPPGAPPARRGARGPDRDEDELRRAIEESKRSLAEEQRKAGALTAEEQDLQKAIRLSEEEEARRNKAVEDSNAASLFDDQCALPPSLVILLLITPPTNPFPFIDPTPYATGLQVQPQHTQLQPQFTSLQPQFTSFNPYQQQAQQEAMQAEYLRQQQEWLQAQQLQQQQAQLQAQQQAQQQQEEWFRQQQYQQQQQAQQQQLFAQPTGFGSNNPFAPSLSASPAAASPPLPSHQPSHTQTQPSFNLQGTYAASNGPSYASTPSSSNASPSPGAGQAGIGAGGLGGRAPTRADHEHAHLANLFANRDDGQDTFGNVGALRYGQTDAGRLLAQKTGAGQNNPFALQQQQQQQQHGGYQQGGYGQQAEQPFFSI